jgi:hypothetical protein
MRRAIAIVLAGLTIYACSEVRTSERVPAMNERSNDIQALDRLAARRIFFGHQSVGYNILDGVKDILRDAPRATLRVEETTEAARVEPGVLAHAALGQNGDPSSKIKAFSQVMDGGMAARSDVALFKFCYIDVDADTDVDRLFTEYRDSMQALAARHPSTRLVHVTMPLRMVQTGPKAMVKRLLGRPAGGYVENMKRNRFNDLMRKEYGNGGSLFDLASIEATQPNGRQTTFDFEGKELFALTPAYTSDNGHLNETSRRLVASAFLEVLAARP